MNFLSRVTKWLEEIVYRWFFVKVDTHEGIVIVVAVVGGFFVFRENFFVAGNTFGPVQSNHSPF
jgi:hypothetical protein